MRDVSIYTTQTKILEGEQTVQKACVSPGSLFITFKTLPKSKTHPPENERTVGRQLTRCCDRV